MLVTAGAEIAAQMDVVCRSVRQDEVFQIDNAHTGVRNIEPIGGSCQQQHRHRVKMTANSLPLGRVNKSPL